MGRIIGLVLMVAGIWYVVTTYGVSGGGSGEESRASVPKRAGAAVEKAYAEGAARRDAIMPD